MFQDLIYQQEFKIIWSDLGLWTPTKFLNTPEASSVPVPSQPIFHLITEGQGLLLIALLFNSVSNSLGGTLKSSPSQQVAAKSIHSAPGAPSTHCPGDHNKLESHGAVIIEFCISHTSSHWRKLMDMMCYYRYYRGLLCVCMRAHSVVSNSLWPTRLLWPWDSPGKNTEMGCYYLLQRQIFYHQDTWKVS